MVDPAQKMEYQLILHKRE